MKMVTQMAEAKGFKSAAIEVEVLSDLRRLSYELSAQENRRVSISDTLRLLLTTYNEYNLISKTITNDVKGNELCE